MSARDEILKRPQQFRPFTVFDGVHSLRVLTGKERDTIGKLSKTCSEANDFSGYREKAVILLLGDAGGGRVFRDEDFDVVAGLDSIELERILHEGLKLNKLIEDKDEAKKA